ncbi:membrane protein [Algimonas arctica]|uniref:Membrane protein n=1 Tax=Algimonas arctica TaxID=1479486 RepID=A0A8J3CKP8_9PROT|nr:GDYXXLXY domain-containing protein [Algimonas arctica]GHA82760.1 membrane protein [Algimonas arctica]
MIRIALVIVGLLLCGWKFTSGFVAAEAIRQNGEEILFELAPVDPRDLFLGDYMTLNYDLGLDGRWDEESADFDRPIPEEPDAVSGVGVVKITDGVATFVRFDALSPLAEDERLIRFTKRRRWARVSIGGDRYYFQSGTGDRFAEAEYGIFRVMPDGRALLSGLADEKKRPILIAGEAPLKILED